MENVSPECIEQSRADHKSVHRHPQPVGKGCESKTYNEIGEDGWYEDYKGFCSYKIEEEPHDPGKECLHRGVEVTKPVGDDREYYID